MPRKRRKRAQHSRADRARHGANALRALRRSHLHKAELSKAKGHEQGYAAHIARANSMQERIESRAA